MTTKTQTGNIIETVLHYYRFDISQPDQKEKYLALCDELKSKGLKKFDSISPDHSTWYAESIAPLNGKIVQLETKFLFNNQWNTAKTETSETGLRVFDWAEAIYPNKKLKEGQYLEQTEDMTTIRQQTYKCGYCGKNHFKPNVSFCDSCIGSEYLTEDQLYMLFLQPVANEDSRKNAIVPESLIAKYRETQRIARLARLEKQKQDDKKRAEDKLQSLQTEYNGFKWLIEHDLNFDNVIFYDHSQTFCFGWRNSIEDKEAFKTKLTGFPYQYQIK